jgi:hypothetical protein
MPDSTIVISMLDYNILNDSNGKASQSTGDNTPPSEGVQLAKEDSWEWAFDNEDLNNLWDDNL